MRKVIAKLLTVLLAVFVISTAIVPKDYVRADGTASAGINSSWDGGRNVYVSFSNIDTNGGPITVSISFDGYVTGVTSYWGCSSCYANGSTVTLTVSNFYGSNHTAGFVISCDGYCTVSRGSTSFSFSQSSGATPTNTPTPTPTNTPAPTVTPVPTTAPTTASTTQATAAPTNQGQPEAPVVVVPVDTASQSPEVVIPVEPVATDTAPADTAPVAEATTAQATAGNNSNNTEATEETTVATEETTVPIVIIDVNGNEIVVTPTPTPTPFPRYIAMFVDPNDSMAGFPWKIVNVLLVIAIIVARLVALKIQGAKGLDYAIDFVPFGIVRSIVDNIQYSQDKRRRMKEPEKNNGYMERENNHANSSASAAEAAKAAQEARAEFAKAAAERNAAKASANSDNGLKAPVKRPASASVNHAQAASQKAPESQMRKSPFKKDEE